MNTMTSGNTRQKESSSVKTKALFNFYRVFFLRNIFRLHNIECMNQRNLSVPGCYTYKLAPIKLLKGVFLCIF